MHSTDRTLSIARELADVTLCHDGGPQGLIHVNKNRGFDAAKGPWILNLDADERLTTELRDEIVAVLEGASVDRVTGEASSATSESEPIVAYDIPFTHFFFGKYLRHGGYRNRLVRLFRKGALRYPEDRAHSTPEVSGVVASLRGLVVHFNHPDVRSFVEKMNRYTSSDAPLLVEHGRGGLRNRSLPANLGWKMFSAPLGVFWNRYIRHAGFRDGVHGFVAAALMAFYQFIEYAKAWEAQHGATVEE